MNEADALDLEQAIRDNYRLWNEGKREELDRLFRTLGPDGFTIEYVGSPALDGAAAMAEMWAESEGRHRDAAKPGNPKYCRWQADDPLFSSDRPLTCHISTCRRWTPISASLAGRWPNIARAR